MKTQFVAVMGALALSAVLAQPASAENVGQHPAVLAAQKWDTRGIDPNTFIVLHPAGLRLLPASHTLVAATHEIGRPAAPAPRAPFQNVRRTPMPSAFIPPASPSSPNAGER